MRQSPQKGAQIDWETRLVCEGASCLQNTGSSPVRTPKTKSWGFCFQDVCSFIKPVASYLFFALPDQSVLFHWQKAKREGNCMCTKEFWRIKLDCINSPYQHVLRVGTLTVPGRTGGKISCQLAGNTCTMLLYYTYCTWYWKLCSPAVILGTATHI